MGQNDGNTSAPSSIQIQPPPYTSLYNFTYLASVVSTLEIFRHRFSPRTEHRSFQAVHRDPYGKTPRSTLFVEEGIRIANERLDGKEGTFHFQFLLLCFPPVP